MIKSVCGYCGVGCGLEFEENKLIGDVVYPTNEGKLCSKGISELISIQTPTRLLRPHIREDINTEYKVTSWEDAISTIANKIKKTSKEKIGFYLSGQLLTEDYYIANKLGKGFIGTNNVDTNSRTCMSSAVSAHKKAFGIDYVPVRMEDVHIADLLILAGANTAEAHVVFHNRIKKAKKAGLKIIVIDPRFTDTAKIADLHLPLKPNSDIDFFNLVSKRIIDEGLVDEEFIKTHVNNYELLKNKFKRIPVTKMLKRTGLTKEQFEEFWLLYKSSENIISAWTMGLNQSSQGVDKNLALINTHLLSGKIFKAGNGPFSLTGQPNAMGGREVGGLSTMLAVHLGFDSESIKKVSQFWNTKKIDKNVGLTATQMLDANLDVLIICHTDPVYHLPNRNKVEELIKKIPMVVEMNAYENSETSDFAHIKLPAAPWGEKEGTQTNLDRTVTKQEKLTRSSIDCKADWEIFQLLAQELGFKNEFNYSSSQEIFEEFQEMTKLNPHLNMSETSYSKLKEEPFIWGEKIRKNKEFFTENKKANLHFVQNKLLSEKANLIYPLILLTGRTRDQWHSGTKTNLPRTLLKFKDLNFCEIHPKNAKAFDIKDGDFIKISSRRGEIESKALITDSIREDTIFIPVSHREINYLTNDLLDKESLQPDYNHSAVKIEKLS
ncbi:molybdopterin oxidoreductase family protein [Poseidonibacter ostreae]|jgi:ferredoxin-nitrate reductase|uniref:Molybdopterin-dependent oxidoreductase n=1 Tax=Poseidonibacter ostreae TaxID=2654171 RepID=A0A6L4WTQ8_9BACT|nr:molybdopterin oxidoreductase family protein [Poseidonibacter ostreae]KAB7885917.1 molybdopterin-dependent oxidoreductase [Poseidonibacter ostreae]KAB7889394.1 molybdopterin-dependent oxidoreductase [Poseidonibacter ostreae]KAB7891670.1 molybdopterin-dependent oxidoreductase [Poseidonibacter ostreae]MAC83992.1 nitrate reductase [Arcobacter sp.]|tara:strand:- start:5141 stop:7132 length:1992 start_codon:yes stop_codon:yes gene_type:complete